MKKSCYQLTLCASNTIKIDVKPSALPLQFTHFPETSRSLLESLATYLKMFLACSFYCENRFNTVNEGTLLK